MAQHFCDFIPQSDGWAVLMDGRIMASYPSLHLAVSAVKTGSLVEAAGGKRLVMRRLDADGILHELSTSTQNRPGYQAGAAL